jgi:UDP-3-O-[3-hydroxymyristoyl] glucosamine N-acyltransferase
LENYLGEESSVGALSSGTAAIHWGLILLGVQVLRIENQLSIVFCRKVPNLFFIHSAAYISPSAKIGLGVVITPLVNVGANVQIGDFTSINARASIGHDTITGKHNFIAPNVCFFGFTKIGDDNLFRINSATIPGIVVGNRNKIASGMILDKNVDDDTVVFHRFKEKVIAIPKL